MFEIHGGGQQPPAGGGGLARAGEGRARPRQHVGMAAAQPCASRQCRGRGGWSWWCVCGAGTQASYGGVGAAMHEAAAWRDSRALAAVMGHDAFHHWAHGGSGARLLSGLDPLDGKSQRDLAEAAGLHRTTVKRRMDRLVEDGLAELTDDLYYLPRHLADDAGLDADEEELKRVAHERGTDGLGERRRQRHAQQRAAYQRYLEWRAERAARRYQSDRPRLRLVPDDVVNPHTGEVDARWAGWDITDPYHPVWTGDLALAPPGEPRARACG